MHVQTASLRDRLVWYSVLLCTAWPEAADYDWRVMSNDSKWYTGTGKVRSTGEVACAWEMRSDRT